MIESSVEANKHFDARHAWTPWLVLACCLAMTAGVTCFVLWTDREQASVRFQNAVQDAELSIRNRLDVYLALLRGGSGLFAAADHVSAEEFHDYVARLDIGANYPGIQGFGFSQRVRPGEAETLVAEMKARGFLNFSTWPPTNVEPHSIIYLEPLDARNRAAIGYNMFSDPTRNAAMARARDTGLPAASGKVRLVQEIDERKQAGFLIYVPVYNGTPQTVEERRASLRGFVYAPFRADDLFAGIFGTDAPRLEFEVYDTGNTTEATLMHRSITRRMDPRRGAIASPIEIGGRLWTIMFYTTPELETSAMSPVVPLTAAAGLLATLLLFGTTLSQRNAQLAAEQSARELQQSQQALRESEELHRIIGETAADAIITIDQDNRIVTANRAAERIFQYSLDELVGREFSILIPESMRQRHREGLDRFVRGGANLTSPRFEFPGLRKDGTVVPLEITFGVARRAERFLFIGVLRDISERKVAEAQQARRAQHTALRADVTLALTRPGAGLRELLQECAEAIIRSMPAAFARVWTLEAELQVLVLQASAGIYTHLDGAHSRIPLGQFKIGRIAAARKPDCSNDLLSDPQVDRAWACEHNLVAYAGFPLLVEDRLIGVLALFAREPLTDDAVEALGGVADIIAQGVQRKQAEQALQQAQEELQRHARELERRVAERTVDLQESVQSLESFSYSIAHDLRAPLRTIHSFTDLLLHDYVDKLDNTAQGYGRRVINAAKRMDDLIRDLLAYGRLSRHELPNRPMPLQVALNAALDELRPEIESRGAIINVPPSLPRVVANETLLDQVLTNLISNGLKFVAPGVTPRIDISTEQRNGKVRLLLRDNGIGIEPEQHKRIFGVFERLHGVERYPGTGIGLAIVHKAVERMNGHVGVESEPGQGSTFWVELVAA